MPVGKKQRSPVLGVTGPGDPSGGSPPQSPSSSVLLPPPPSSGCSSPVLLHAGLHRMSFPGRANLAATCSLCRSQQSGSASNPEQLGERVPSLVISLAPLLCCNSAAPAPVTCCRLGSPFSSPPCPARLLLASSGLSLSWEGCRASLRLGHSLWLSPPCLVSPPQPRLAVPFPPPIPVGPLNFLLPGASNRRTEAGVRV